MSEHNALADLNPDDVHAGSRYHRMVLIDVREPAECAAERISGVLFPPPTFDPRVLPADPGPPVVFYCSTGKRSAMAAVRCREEAVAVSAHLAGALAVWKAAGLPIVGLNAAAGAARDRK